MARDLWRDDRGASFVEYIVILGAVALLCIGVFRTFGSTVTGALEREQRQISAVNSAPGAQHASAGSGAESAGARAGSAGGGVSARAGGGGGSGAGDGSGGGESSGPNGKNYLIIFFAAAVIVSFIVIKIRRTIGEAPS